MRWVCRRRDKIESQPYNDLFDNEATAGRQRQRHLRRHLHASFDIQSLGFLLHLTCLTLLNHLNEFIIAARFPR